MLNFVFEGNFQVHAPRGAYIWRGDLTEDFLRYKFGELVFVGLIHGRAYLRNFTFAVVVDTVNIVRFVSVVTVVLVG